VVFVFVRRAPEHFSLVFVFGEMFACTAMAEGPLRLRRDRYSEYSLAATCRQALDKRDQWLLWQRENGVVPPLIGHTSVGSAVKSSLCWQTLAKRVGPNIPRYASIRPTQLGSCVDLVPVHEDSAFVLRVFTRGDNERLSYAIE
jgi:hypothetical protein